MNTQPIPITPENRDSIKYPCWLWCIIENRWEWRKSGIIGDVDRWSDFTHYHPDQPEPPACVPEDSNGPDYGDGPWAEGWKERSEPAGTVTPDPTPLQQAAMEAAIQQAIDSTNNPPYFDKLPKWPEARGELVSRLVAGLTLLFDQLVRERDEAREEARRLKYFEDCMASAVSVPDYSKRCAAQEVELATLRARLREAEESAEREARMVDKKCAQVIRLERRLETAQAKLTVAKEMAGALSGLLQHAIRPGTMGWQDETPDDVKAFETADAALAKWNAVNKEEGK